MVRKKQKKPMMGYSMDALELNGKNFVSRVLPQGSGFQSLLQLHPLKSGIKSLSMVTFCPWVAFPDPFLVLSNPPEIPEGSTLKSVRR